MAKRKAKAPRRSQLTAKRDDKRGKNPNSLANLEAHKFAPGVSGNPSGRPKLLGESYKEWLATVNEQDLQKRTNAQMGAVAIGLEMLKGDVSAAREIRAATEGESLKLSGELVLKGYVGITPDEWDADSDTDPDESDAAQAG